MSSENYSDGCQHSPSQLKLFITLPAFLITLIMMFCEVIILGGTCWEIYHFGIDNVDTHGIIIYRIGLTYSVWVGCMICLYWLSQRKQEKNE